MNKADQAIIDQLKKENQELKDLIISGNRADVEKKHMELEKANIEQIEKKIKVSFQPHSFVSPKSGKKIEGLTKIITTINDETPKYIKTRFAALMNRFGARWNFVDKFWTFPDTHNNTVKEGLIKHYTFVENTD